MSAKPVRVGLLSDTHGLLRPEALEAMRGSDFIVHAGDIGDATIIARLAAIAPVTVVRGNNDVGPWAAAIPCTATLIVGVVRIHVIHDLFELATDPQAEGFDVVVSGHSHRPRIEARDGILYVNPGSAGPRRFTLPVSVGSLVVPDRRSGRRCARSTLRRRRAPAPARAAGGPDACVAGAGTTLAGCEPGKRTRLTRSSTRATIQAALAR